MKYQSINEILVDIEKHPIAGDKPLYHPIPFAEFNHLETSSNKLEVLLKWEVIADFIESVYGQKFSQLNILDIGANAGFFTFNLAKRGAKVEAFEPNPRYSAIGKFLAKQKKLDVIWHGLDYKKSAIQLKKFDVSLILSTFQWMAEGGRKMHEATISLHEISEMSDNLIFELGFNKGSSCIKTKKLNHYSVLFDLLKQNTVYTNFKLLGKTYIWENSKRFIIACSKMKKIRDCFFTSLLRKISI